MGLSTVSYSSAALATMRSSERLPVHVMRIVSDADQGAAPPVSNDGEAWIVNNWGAGVYVGAAAGVAFADGDLAEYSDRLAGFVRVLLNTGGLPTTGIRAVVVQAGAAGAFVGLANQIAYRDVAAVGWIFTAPVDGNLVHVIGEESFAENQNWTYDVNTWRSQGKAGLGFNASVFVDQLNGSDTQGDGSFDRPYRTLGAAYTAATAGQTIVAGPGTYAETLNIVKRVHIAELIPDTVIIANAVVGGAVVTINGAAGTSRISVHRIENTNNATVADIALAIANTTPAAVVAEVNVNVLSGGLLGTALGFTGDATNAQATSLRLKAAQIIGCIGDIVTANAGDLLQVDAKSHLSSVATWGSIPGAAGTAGTVRLAIFSTAAGILNIGGGAALGANVFLESGSWIGGSIVLNNAAGAGILTLLGEAAANIITAGAADQIYHRRVNDDLEVNCLNIDINAIDDTEFYTVPAGRTFLPLFVQLINRGVASGAALIYQVDGTGAASIKASVGAAALAIGITNATVLRDLMAAAAVMSLNVTAASGAADFADIKVTGKLA